MIRILDILFSLLGILIFAPVSIIIVILIIIDSPGSAFFIQERVGINKTQFKLIKFRTMFSDSNKKSLITIGKRDSRITRIGYYLRKSKADELPQLINVLKGEMSFVGPRPEVIKYVELYTPEQLEILNVVPGLTDYASIVFRNENELLEGKENPEDYYIRELLPRKIELNMKYIHNRSIRLYLWLIVLTITSLFRKTGKSPF